MATSQQRPPLYNGNSFGGQSIHSLLFQPLYNGCLSTMATFFCANKVAVVERLNCISFETLNVNKPPGIYWGHVMRILLFEVNSVLKSLLSALTHTQNASVEL